MTLAVRSVAGKIWRGRVVLGWKNGLCPLCGGSKFVESQILWPELIEQWELDDAEAAYVNRQQGLKCTRCRGNLRSMALAQAIAENLGTPQHTRLVRALARRPLLKVLEINPAGSLTPFLSWMPRHTLVRYPNVDMKKLPYPDETFDFIVHSDTLEHIPGPTQGLRESYRVLRPGGFTCFTVPIVLGRLTRSREGLVPSFHGNRSNPQDCLVQTEYGADVWSQVLDAGFTSCTIHSLSHPAALALSARRPKHSLILEERRGL